jgi:hypothetical protein
LFLVALLLVVLLLLLLPPEQNAQTLILRIHARCRLDKPRSVVGSRYRKRVELRAHQAHVLLRFCQRAL